MQPNDFPTIIASAVAFEAALKCKIHGGRMSQSPKSTLIHSSHFRNCASRRPTTRKRLRPLPTHSKLAQGEIKANTKDDIQGILPLFGCSPHIRLLSLSSNDLLGRFRPSSRFQRLRRLPRSNCALVTSACMPDLAIASEAGWSSSRERASSLSGAPRKGGLLCSPLSAAACVLPWKIAS